MQTIARKLIMEAMPAIWPRGHRCPIRRALRRRLAPRSTTGARTGVRGAAAVAAGEGDIAGEIGRDVDTDLVHRAREWLRSESGRILEDRLLEAWQRAEPDPTYSPDPLNAGRRALRHGILGLLAAADADEGASLALEHFATARNMTDLIGPCRC